VNSKSTTKFIYDKLIVNMEKAMAPHSSTLAWKIPWTEEPGRLKDPGTAKESEVTRITEKGDE